MTTEAPKRIWASTYVWGDGKPLAGEWNHKDVDSFLDTAYVRADIADDMLEALRELQKRITDQGFPYDGHMLVTCRVAIDKAEGTTE